MYYYKVKENEVFKYKVLFSIEKIRELQKEIEKNQKYLNSPTIKESNKKYYQDKIDKAKKQIQLLQQNPHLDKNKLYKKLFNPLNNKLKYYKKTNDTSGVKSTEKELKSKYDTFGINYKDQYINGFINGNE